MLTEEVVKELNRQIERENNASNHYLAMASWAEARGYAGSAEFLYLSAEDERNHMLQIFRYINANGGHALVPQDRAPHEDTYEGLLSVFKAVYALEEDVTGHINSLADFALTHKDFATFHFLVAFVAEQQGALRETKSILDLFEVIGTADHRLYLVDKQIGKIALAKKGGE